MTLDPLPFREQGVTLNLSASGGIVRLPWLPQRGELATESSERGVPQKTPKDGKQREVETKSMEWGAASRFWILAPSNVMSPEEVFLRLTDILVYGMGCSVTLPSGSRPMGGAQK